MVLVTSEAEEAHGLRAAGAVPDRPNPRWPHSTPGPEGQTIGTGPAGPCGPAQG